MQLDDPPAVPFGMRAQRGIWVRCDRMFHPAQQRQVVQRIAVERAVGEAVEVPATLGQPVVQPGDLSLAEARHIGDVSGEFKLIGW